MESVRLVTDETVVQRPSNHSMFNTREGQANRASPGDLTVSSSVFATEGKLCEMDVDALAVTNLPVDGSADGNSTLRSRGQVSVFLLSPPENLPRQP